MTRAAALTFATVLTTAFLAACDNSASGDDSKSARAGKKSEKSDKSEKGDKGDRAEARRGKFKLGRIDHKAIAESSGLAASRKHPGVYWTHNDSGNGPYVFAIRQDGHFLAEYPVASARNTDWEAIAADDQGHLFVADIGNNDLKRDRALVYRLGEPDPAAAPRGRGPALKVGQLIRLKYPDKPFDAESFFVFQGKGYLVSKVLTGRHAGVYRFDLAAAGADATTLEHVCDLPIRSPVTDAAISDDGKRLAVMTVTGPNLFQIDGDVAAAGKVTPAYVNYFDARDMNMEGVCFTPEGLLASTEQGQMLMFANELFAGKGKENE
jgi:hypothetical protein